MHNDTFIKDNVNMSHSISTLDGQKYADSNATNALFETTKEVCCCILLHFIVTRSKFFTALCEIVGLCRKCTT